jgi:uncharacterized protein
MIMERDTFYDDKWGFASMNPDRQGEIASLGGKAAHAKETAHRWTSAEARAAGKIGGKRKQTSNI